MLNRRCQCVLVLTTGFLFWSLSGLSQADEAQIRAQSKALAHYIMASVDDLQGDNQQAMNEYEKSLKYNSQEALPHLRLGSYYARLGRLNEAIRQFKFVLKVNPNSSEAHYMLALIYSTQKNFPLAANEYEAVLKMAAQDNPDNSDVHAYLAQLYYALRKFPQAQEQLSQVLRFQPKNVSALYLEGNIYLELGEKEKAKEDFRRVLSVEFNHDGALNCLAYLYADEGINLYEALKMVKRAIDLDPTNGAYYDTLGWVLFKQGFNQEALMAFEKAQKFITDPVIFEHMGDVYNASHEPALARQFWQKSLAMDPKQIKLSQKLEELNKTSARNQGAQYHTAK
ncbi:MAG: tetratricopeptide repeat protein [Candidatus Omnitrophica bacterium]|nr:tetratricopeptide repeat protein [Candidatus Omnitrophota bacterium]